MPYAPGVADRSGELLAAGMTGAAQARAAGTQAFSAGVNRGVDSLIAGMSLLDQTLAKHRSNLGALETLRAVAPNVGITQDELDALAKINNPDKLAGALSIYGDIIQQRMKESYLDKQFKTLQQLHDYKRRNPIPTATSQSPANTYVPPVEIGEGVNIW